MVTMMLLRIVCFAPIIGIGALIKVLKESPSMTWIIAVVILVIFGVMAVAFAVVMPKFKIIQNLIDCLNLTMRENLSGMLVIVLLVMKNIVKIVLIKPTKMLQI